MLIAPNQSESAAESRFRGLVRRWPFLLFFLLAVASNVLGSVYNIVYNKLLIIDSLTPAQSAAFWQVVAPVYNLVAYPICLGVGLWLLLLPARCLRRLRAGQNVEPDLLLRCRRRLVNLPAYQVGLNFLGWLPGAVVFPLGVCWLGGSDNAATIWVQFAVSFLVSALVTTMQTFFLLETYLIKVVYPEFFADARPAEIGGAWQIPLPLRLLLYWLAVAVVPMLALLVVAVNATTDAAHRHDVLRALAFGVAIGGILCSGLISFLVGRNLLDWVINHTRATDAVAREDFDVRIVEKRPDEFGRLTDHFNDMAAALGRARLVRQTLGHLVGPRVTDLLLKRYLGLGGEVVEVTVLFADIRGFTARSAGDTPQHAVELLNRFFTLAVHTVEQQHGGLVNKFLGDGVMALFGAAEAVPDHADRAVQAARALLAGLETLNRHLADAGQPPLTIGVGIHTGPALVGCIGAALAGEVRKEFTAIGETVNLCQRLEQLTKTCGGPILLSDATRLRLRRPVPLACLGPQPVPGLNGELIVHRLQDNDSGPL